MNFWERITGSDLTREYKAFELRVEKLPQDYQEMWVKIQVELSQYSDFSGRNLMPILQGVLDMLEESAADGQNIKDIFGDDIKGFCLELVGEDRTRSFREKWRKELNSSIAKKLRK